MDKFIAENPATKRLLVGLAAMGVAGASAKLGISESVVLGVLGLAAAMITGSNWKEAKLAGVEAAATIVTATDAAAALGIKLDVKP